MNGNDWFHIFKCSNEFWQVRNRQIALSLLNVYLQYSFVTVPTSRMMRCEMVENVTACDLYVLIRVFNYRKISNISRTLVSNKIVDHSDVVGASPVGVAPTTSSVST